jgi:hypothetical protein
VDAEQGLAAATPNTAAAQESHAPAITTFANFYRDSYQKVLRATIFAGATLHEAEDAVSVAMTDVLKHWDRIDAPLRNLST